MIDLGRLDKRYIVDVDVLMVAVRGDASLSRRVQVCWVEKSRRMLVTCFSYGQVRAEGVKRMKKMLKTAPEAMLRVCLNRVYGDSLLTCLVCCEVFVVAG